MRALKWLLLATVALGGCSEKTIINNYYSFTSGAISGRVVPSDPGTLVMTVDSVRVKHIDANGFFVLDSLPGGVYGIIVTPINYSRREITDVTVAAGQIVSVGDIKLSTYPFPVFQSIPDDGQDSVRLSSTVALHADERIMLEDLTTLATISPLLSGTWREQMRSSKENGPWSYLFNPSERMRVATEYTVGIPGAVRMTSGITLGRELVVRFTTEPLSFKMSRFQQGINGGVPLLEFAPSILFNVTINADSLSKAIRFTPSIPGLWLEAGKGSGGGQYIFMATGTTPLSPETDYMMLVSDTIALDEDLFLTHPDTVRFTTEPAGVIQSYPQNGSRMHCTLCAVTLVFNTLMDTASVQTAFSLRDIATDSLIPGDIDWHSSPRQMQFNPLVGLTPGTIYQYRLARTAQTLSGHQLSQDYSGSFLVEELQ